MFKVNSQRERAEKRQNRERERERERETRKNTYTPPPGLTTGGLHVCRSGASFSGLRSMT